MNRSGYDDYDGDVDTWSFIRWRGAVNSASNGKRGQRFFIELLDALDSLPEKRLIADRLQHNGEFCALGVLGQAKGLNFEKLTTHDSHYVADAFDIADALAREVVFMNDEASSIHETPEQRFARVRQWVVSQINNEVKGKSE